MWTTGGKRATTRETRTLIVYPHSRPLTVMRQSVATLPFVRVSPPTVSTAPRTAPSCAAWGSTTPPLRDRSSASSRRPATRPVGLYLRWRDAHRKSARQACVGVEHLRSRRRGNDRRHGGGGTRRARTRGRADLRRLPRTIHRQYDGHGLGDTRACATRLVDNSGRCTRSARGTRAQRRTTGDAASKRNSS